jgi:hypothetical protein
MGHLKVIDGFLGLLAYILKAMLFRLTSTDTL